MRWKIFQWTKFLFRHSSNSRKQSRQNFTMNLHVYLLLTAQAKIQTENNNNLNGWRHFGQSEQRKSSALFPIQSERSPDSGFFACDLRKYCIMPSSQKQITELREKGMITGFPLICLDYQSTDSTCACIYVPKIWIANKLPNCILQIVSILHTSNNTYYDLFKAHFLFVTRFLFFSKWTCSIYILMEAYTTTLEYPATCHNTLKNDEV